MKHKLSFRLASDADRDDYYIQLCEDGIEWGTVEEIDGQMVVKIFPHQSSMFDSQPSGDPNIFSVDALQELLTQAVARLQRAQQGEELSRLFPDLDAQSEPDGAQSRGGTDE